ncbi:MAG: FAD-dependent oxidoreductase [Bacilli bacterium]
MIYLNGKGVCYEKEKCVNTRSRSRRSTAAYELLNNGEFNVTILEKENQIGGLCKTIKFKNTLIDYGVHFIE